MSENLDQIVQGKAQKWLDGNYDSKTKDQVKYLMENDKKELTESFYKDLEFGTGGLRGIMGVGTNRMNVYTVGMATQGLANYLKKAFPHEHIKVAIGHDSRNNSRLFSEQVASIFAANGFKVYLFDSLRPTPELSFAIRRLGCQSGVVITASHNPKEYNGYKAYWADGAQVTPPHDKNIIAEVEKITSPDEVLTTQSKDNITILDETFDEIYLDAVHGLSLSPEAIAANRDMKIVLLAALSFAIGKGAFAAVAAWYGKQGGVDFRANVSMLARLAMGMQESPVAAGWYNKYIEQFFAADVTAQQEKEQALAAIGARLGWMRENPAAALAFYREKLLTQWLDPAYDSLWMGELSEKVGRYNGLIGSIYRRKDGLRTLMDGYMDAMQTAVYALSALGGARLMKKKGDMAALALPVTILGGALYHLLFEAKAQYAYPYMVYMLPLAAIGLCRLEEGIKGLWKTKERRH